MWVQTLTVHRNSWLLLLSWLLLNVWGPVSSRQFETHFRLECNDLWHFNWKLLGHAYMSLCIWVHPVLHSWTCTKIYSCMYAQCGWQGHNYHIIVFSRKWNTEFLGHNLRKVKALRHKFCILSWLLDMACKFACVNFIWVKTQAKLQGSWTYWNKICWTGCESVHQC